MGYDPSLNVEHLSVELDTTRDGAEKETKLLAQLVQYNQGALKVGMVRVTKDESGQEKYSKLGRINLEEMRWLQEEAFPAVLKKANEIEGREI